MGMSKLFIMSGTLASLLTWSAGLMPARNGSDTSQKGTDPMNLTYTMDKTAFKNAVQDIADGMASGAAGFSLYDMFQLAPNAPILSMLAQIPGAFKKLLNKVEFKKLSTLRVDYENQVVVVRGDYTIHKIDIEGTGALRFSSNLFLYPAATKTVSGDKTLSANEATKRLNRGLLALSNALNQSVALSFPKNFNLLSVEELSAKIPDVGKELEKDSKFLKPIEGLIKGAAILAYTSQNYVDPVAGYLNVLGLNIVGQVNFDQKLNDALAQKLLNDIGAAMSEGRGLWVHVVLPLSLNGLEAEIYLPGVIEICPQMIAGKSCKGKPFLTTKRLRIGMQVLAFGMEESYKLQTYVASGAEISIPWQKEPLEIDLKFTLVSDDTVQFQTDVEHIDLATLPKSVAIPVDIEHLMVTGSLDYAIFVEAIQAIIKSLINIVSSTIKELFTAGETEVADVPEDAVAAVIDIADSETGPVVEGVEAAVEAAGNVATVAADEAPEVAEEVAKETKIGINTAKDILANLLFPINMIGLAGDAVIAGREVDVEFCLFVEEQFKIVTPLIKVHLTKGQKNNFITLADILDIFYDLQKNQFEFVDKLPTFPDKEKLIDFLNAILKGEDEIKKLADASLKNIKLDEALLVIAPLPGYCGTDYYTFSTMEIQGSGSIMGEEFQGDITLNLGLDYLLALISVGQMVSDSGSSLSSIGDALKSLNSIENVGSELGKFSMSAAKVGWNVLSMVGKDAYMAIYGAESALMGLFNIGIFANASLSKPFKAGPVAVSSKDGKTGPSVLFAVGFPHPLAPHDPFSAFLDTDVSGLIKVDLKPEFQADFKGKIKPLGFEIEADGKLGTFDTHLDASLMLSKKFLDSEFKFSITGGWEDLASALTTIGKDIATEGEKVTSKAAESLGKAKKMTQEAEDKFATTSQLLNSYTASLKKCTKGMPGSDLADDLNSIIDKGLMTVNPQYVTGEINKYVTMGIDVASLKNNILDSMDNNGPLSKIVGLKRALTKEAA